MVEPTVFTVVDAQPGVEYQIKLAYLGWHRISFVVKCTPWDTGRVQRHTRRLLDAEVFRVVISGDSSGSSEQRCEIQAKLLSHGVDTVSAVPAVLRVQRLNGLGLPRDVAAVILAGCIVVAAALAAFPSFHRYFHRVAT